ncbi:MAG: hypothetical protein J5J06_18600 [Phycisphaerae bacterium]|nr:hypothetical protein [Phycisphaerae bacterium]
MLAAIFLIAFLVRFGWGAYRFNTSEHVSALEFPDERQYWHMASSLREGDGLRDEFGFRASRMPLYPAFLALAGSEPTGVLRAIFRQWLIGGAAAALAAGLACSMISARAGLIAGLIVAFDPFLVFFSSLLLTETAATTALIGLWWAAWPAVGNPDARFSNRRALGIGILMAISVYLRESSLGLIILLTAWMIWSRRNRRGDILRAVGSLLIVALALAPWAIRNRLVTGHWVVLTTRGGISLYDGVRPGADGSSNLADVQQAPEVAHLDEVAWNEYFLNASFKAIRDNPERILDLAAQKMERMWNPFPNVGSYQSPLIRLVSAAWMVPFYALAVAGIFILPKIRGGIEFREVFFLLLPALYLSALHSLFVGSVRYRLPAIPMLAVLAAATLAAPWFGRRGSVAGTVETPPPKES